MRTAKKQKKENKLELTLCFSLFFPSPQKNENLSRSRR